jgi:hypothetical protein
MEKEQTVSITPRNPYACNINFQSTRRSFLAFRGRRSKTSASGFSYAIAVAAAQSVKQQMMIIKKDERIWGRPNVTFVMTGQNSEKEPAGRR